MDDTWDKLRQLSKDLGEASDELTAELKEIESRVNECNIGIQVEDFDHPLLVEDGVLFILGYRRNKKKWGLVVCQYEPVNKEEPDDSDIVCINEYPLMQASRDIRLKARENIGHLLDLLYTEGEKLLTGVQEANEKLKKNRLGGCS